MEFPFEIIRLTQKKPYSEKIVLKDGNESVFGPIIIMLMSFLKRLYLF